MRPKERRSVGEKKSRRKREEVLTCDKKRKRTEQSRREIKGRTVRRRVDKNLRLGQN